MASLFELTKSLIGIPSVTGQEAPLADRVAAEMDRPPFRVQAQPVEGDRRNLWITADGPPRVVLCTHLDTVPGEAVADEDDEFIYGRGACDAKGSLAAMMVAALELAQEGETGFGALFVVGEETDSCGARLANSLAPGSRSLIVGEPTDNRLALGHKGALFVRLTARGKRAHSALPQWGESAVEKLLDVLADIRSADLGHDPLLGKTLLNIGRVEGGIAPNVVADEAAAVLGLRPAVSVARTLGRLAERAAGRVETEIITASEPQRLWTLAGLETSVFPFATDIPHLGAFGRPLLLGPGSARWAHADGERVEKRQLVDAVRIYKSLVRRLLAGEEPVLPEGRASSGERAG